MGSVRVTRNLWLSSFLARLVLRQRGPIVRRVCSHRNGEGQRRGQGCFLYCRRNDAAPRHWNARSLRPVRRWFCHRPAIVGVRFGCVDGTTHHRATNVTGEPLWQPWLWLAEQFDYRACWSFSVETSSGKIVGTFAMYFKKPRDATEDELDFAAMITRAAAIAM